MTRRVDQPQHLKHDSPTSDSSHREGLYGLTVVDRTQLSRSPGARQEKSNEADATGGTKTKLDVGDHTCCSLDYNSL
jgi:hypothetical protein